MSNLPPALLERLKRRGIIKVSSDENATKKPALDSTSKNKELFDAAGCPHKCTLTHNCNEFCVKKFGDGVTDPPLEVLHLYERLVQKYPLPDEWIEVWEPGTSRFYFWNSKDDQVCWYPPSHPKAKITLSALKLKELRRVEGGLNRNDQHETEQARAKQESYTNQQGSQKNLVQSELRRKRKSNDEEHDERSEADEEEDGKKEEEEEEEENDAESLTPHSRCNSESSSGNDQQDSDDAESNTGDEGDASDRESIDSIDEQLESVYN